jgi:hypothetical protein
MVAAPLDSFFKRTTAQFHTWFEGDADFEADVTSSRFWKNYLGVRHRVCSRGREWIRSAAIEQTYAARVLR